MTLPRPHVCRADGALSLPHPVAIGREYERDLMRRVEATHRLAMEQVDRELTALRIDAPAALPSVLPPGDAASVISVITRVEGLVAATLRVDPAPIRKRGERIDAFTTPHVHRLIGVVAGTSARPSVVRIPTSTIAPTGLLDEWVAENVDLIKSIDSRYFGDLRRVTLDAFRRGVNRNDLARIYEERYQVSRSRGLLIADDQVGKLNGRINRYRQMEAGVDEYDWSDSNDQRVRPLHVDRNGKRFRWDQHPSAVDGQPDGHPGEPVRCRCSGIPVV